MLKITLNISQLYKQGSIVTKILILIFAILQSCKTATPNKGRSNSIHEASGLGQRPSQPKMCAAVRGNGNYIFAHWGAMAKVIEELGPFEGFAGGSSASITGYVYENIYRNPNIWTCDNGTRACTRDESSLRISLMLKSLVVYMDQFKMTSGLHAQISGRNKFLLGLQAKRINKSVEDKRYVDAAKGALKILRKPEFKGIINPSFAEHLENSLGSEQQAAFAVKDLMGSLDAIQWKIDDPSVFFRKGIIDFETFGAKVGVLVDFFAGVEGTTLADTRLYLDGCAANSRGKRIEEILPSPSLLPPKNPNTPNPTCLDLIGNAINKHFERVLVVASEEAPEHRVINYESKTIDEPVGKFLPTIVTNSYFTEKQGFKAFETALASFETSRMPPKIGFDLDWLKFGYYGQPQDLSRIMARSAQRQDLKSRKAGSLGTRTWREVLRISPLEPGLGSAQCLLKEGNESTAGEWKFIPDVKDLSQCLKISTGGWSDLEPVDILKDIGCESVVMIHRAGPATTFAQRMISFMSKDEAQYQKANKDLYELSNANSSYSRNLGLADGVMCTNWDSIPKGVATCLINHSYSSKIFTTKPNALKPLLNNNASEFEKFVDSQSKVYGCSVGAPSTTPFPRIDCPELADPLLEEEQ
jgi:hypothetical protein